MKKPTISTKLPTEEQLQLLLDNATPEELASVQVGSSKSFAELLGYTYDRSTDELVSQKEADRREYNKLLQMAARLRADFNAGVASGEAKAMSTLRSRLIDLTLHAAEAYGRLGGGTVARRSLDGVDVTFQDD